MSTTDTKTALWKNYTDDQRKAVEEIAKWQTSANLSDAAFVEGCSTMSEQSWYQLHTGRYGAKDCSRMVSIAKSHSIERRRTYLKSLTLKPLAFIESDKYTEVINAVDSAQAAADIGDDDKIIFIIGASGMGKTEIARQLVKLKTASLVTASESWREGFLDALTDFAEAIGIPQPTNADGKVKQWQSKGAAEREIMRKLKASPRVLCVNEVEFFSRRVLNLLRKIADETKTVVVIFCVPEFYSEILKQGGAHAKQLRTRTEGVVWLDQLEKADVSKVLAHYWPAMLSDAPAASELAQYVNTFGGWRVLKRIARNLHSKFPLPTHPPALPDISAEINLQRDYQAA